MIQRYIVGAYWPSRKETLDHCAARLQQFFVELEASDPAFLNWYERGRSRKDAVEKRVNATDIQYLRGLLDRGRNRRDVDHAIMEELGFRIGVWNGARDLKEAGINIACGLHWEDKQKRTTLYNSIVVDLPKELGDLKLYENIIKLVRAMVRVWEPSWAGVMSKNAMVERDFDPARPFVDWIVYVNKRINLPTTLCHAVEYIDQGTIIVVHPTPPSVDNTDETSRIRQVDHALRQALVS